MEVSQLDETVDSPRLAEICGRIDRCLQRVGVVDRGTVNLVVEHARRLEYLLELAPRLGEPGLGQQIRLCIDNALKAEG